MAVTDDAIRPANAGDEGRVCRASPYLPPTRGKLGEAFVRIRARTTYRIWKRVIAKYCKSVKTASSGPFLLDVGCGCGRFLYALRAWFPKATLYGLDLSTDLLDSASKRVADTTWVQADGEQLPFADATFDIISCLQVTEHLQRPGEFLRESHRVLIPGGLLLLATPNPRGLAARILAERWQGIREDHVSLKTPNEWRHMLAETGFMILSEGTTLLSGLPLLRMFPIGIPFQAAQAVFGYFPWSLGESFMAVARKIPDHAVD
jgi:ubiquinone/menaquinone biosynthesis C-methylase UbiE